MEISLKETGSGRISLEVGEWRRRTLDMSPALRRIAEHLRKEAQEAFDSSGANLPARWRPLKPRTIARKADAGDDRRVLVRRGDLMRSLTDEHDARHIEKVTPGELYFGTRSPVARLSRAQGRNPVQRPRDTRPIMDILAAHISGRL